MTEEDIKELCEYYDIENYVINYDMSVDVDDYCLLIGLKISKIPLKFGKVTGNFYCYNNKLTTLEHCPKYVGGEFSCSKNKLTTLEHCPQYINGIFYCSNNILTSLEYCPTYVGGDFNCAANKITTLNHLPINFYVGGNFYCLNNNLTAPSEYSRLFFGTIGGEIITSYKHLDNFLNKHKNPPKKELPKILSELRKIKL